MISILYIITKDSLSPHERTKLKTSDNSTFIKISVYEFEENIDSNGNIITPITESKINPLLRYIFENNFEKIKIQLTNADKNLLHARNLQNIISASPYKGEIELIF